MSRSSTAAAALRALQFLDVFDAAAAAMPSLAPWVDPELTVAISPVAVMGGIRNTIRFPLTHGRPRLLGLHAVGDALAITNPAFGRGASLAIAQAEIVVDGLAGEPDSPLRRATLGLPPSVPPPPTAVPMPVALAATAVDAEVWVRLVRVIQLLDPPQAVFDDPALAARIGGLDLLQPQALARREALLTAIDKRAASSEARVQVPC